MAVSLNGDGTITGLSTLSSVTITGLTSLTTTDLTADTTTLVVDSANNRVGIGTASPSTTLQVVGTATATAFSGPLTGNVTGDVSGNAGTVTNGVYTTDIGSTVQAYDADLTTLAGLSSADGNFIVGSATGWVAESGATARTSLGLGTAATSNTGDFATASQGTTADSALQPADIGSTVQAYDADLTTLAGLSSADGNFIVGSASGWVAESGATARTSLGLGTAATSATGDFATAAQGTTADSALQPADIGSTVQAYDADTTKNDVANTFTANQTINGDLTVDTNTLYVDSTNNRVGIGTSSPADPLEISHATTSRMRFSETTNSLALNIGQWSAKNRIEGSGGSDLIISNYDASNPIAFYTGSGAGNTERMRIDSSGNVGIGTSSPSSKLDVSGTVTATAFSGDGSALTNLPSGGVTPGSQIFTSPGTFSVPDGVNKVTVRIMAGGGGGSGGPNGSNSPAAYGFCGGGGGFAIAYHTVTPGGSHPVTVGSGGGGGGPNANGATGGSSSFASPSGTTTATGGAGGLYPGGQNGVGGLGGSGSTYGNPGGNGNRIHGGVCGIGGSNVGATASTVNGVTGGIIDNVSVTGQYTYGHQGSRAGFHGGPASPAPNNGTAGLRGGGGGSGWFTNAGSAGGPGYVIVEW